MKPITFEQLKCINTLVSKLKIDKENKAYMVQSFSAGRATSSKDLRLDEATDMIRYLKTTDPDEQAMERMRRKVFALAYTIGFIWGDTPADKKMNGAKLDKFLKERGTVKKSLNEMSKADLVKVVSQFSEMEKHTHQAGANTATRSLLAELDISVEKSKQKGI